MMCGPSALRSFLLVVLASAPAMSAEAATEVETASTARDAVTAAVKTASTAPAAPADADLDADPYRGLYADGRDHWTLLRQSSVNRSLNAQGAEPRGAGRLLLEQGRFSGIVDGTIGWQQPLGPGPQTRFHGYYVLDTYVGFRVLEQLELNLNFTIFNPSASDGYRTSADILTGFTVNLHETFIVEGEPLRIDVIGFDLDVMTTGIGLFFEQLPVEGWLLGVRYRGAELRATWGGRALFSDDNFVFAEVTLFDRRIGLTYTSWFGDLTTDEIGENAQAVDSFHAVYVGLFGDLEIFDGFRVAAEYAARIDSGQVRSAAIGRVDWRSDGKLLIPYQIHVGYQARMYLNQFGPRGIFVQPTQTPNTPRREDIYVTNSFEYFEYTPFFDQFSHTGMFELTLRPLANWQIYGQVELWYRTVAATGDRVVGNQRFGRFPGDHFELFYRCGIDFFPWSDWPHRFSVYATNKAVVAATDVRVALPNRLDHRDFLFLEGVFRL